jgi:transposase
MSVTLRKQMAIHAERFGVSEAAEAFGTTRKTVRLWRDRYRAEGMRGLADRSRAPKHIPHKTSEATARHLVEVRQRYPRWGVGRLKWCFRVRCSQTAAARILRQAGLTQRRPKKRVRNDLRAQKALLRPFEKLQVDTKELRDIPEYARWMRERGLPRYQFSARDLRTGAAWFAYAGTNDGWTGALFAAYVLGQLRECGVDLSATTVQTDNGSEYVGSARKRHGEPTLFEHVVAHYTGRPPVSIFPGAKTSQSDVEAFHRLVEDELLAIEDLSTLERLTGCSRTYQAYFNHHRVLLWKGGKTPAQLFLEAQGDSSSNSLVTAFALPPIVLEDLVITDPRPGYDVPDMVSPPRLDC